MHITGFNSTSRIYFSKILNILWFACAARVAVVVLCVCLCVFVCLCVCVCVCVFCVGVWKIERN